jgi:hypothetical protein
MPLARTTLYNQGVELYLAPTADARESWQATIRHIALEGRCFVLACNQFVFVTKADYPDDLDRASQRELADAPDPLCRGGSAIIGPLGEYPAGPLWDEAGILYAHVDLGAITEAHFDFDVVGHYSRPDLFHLATNPITGDAFPSWDEVEALDNLIFGSPVAGSFLDALANAPEPFFGPPDDDPNFPAFPATWTEKKADWKPSRPAKRRRRK